jgi:glyoxylase-like metal-dependent hydrolase (beta-lactamase superfamily II)
VALPDGVACVTAPNPSLMTGEGTNSYLIAGGARACAIVDPGPDDDAHLTHLAHLATAHGGARAILVTHGHPDHAAGAARLRALTGAPILAYCRDDGVPEADRLLADGEQLAIGERTLIALHTPGHRFDHLCFLLPDVAALIAGDLVSGAGTVVIAPPEGDLLEYMASLRRLLALDPRQILPAHGPTIDRPAALLQSYIEHREERERQILACLTAGESDVAGLVARIYADIDPALHPVAAHTVTAHLLKLEREGHVLRGAHGAGVEVWRHATRTR